MNQKHSSPRLRPLRWMPALLLPLLGGIAVGQAQAQSYGQDRYYEQERYPQQGQGVVRCESVSNRSRECRLDGQPRLIRQLSGSPCIQGETWGSTRDGVWVTRGCRAEFVGEYRGRPGGHGGNWGGGWGGRPGHHDDRGRGQVIDCDSNDRRQRRCDVEVRRGVELVRQKSGTACIEGRTWGWDRRGVWVNGGCRAQFRVN